MNDIDAILVELRKFNQERDWDQFHNGKDLAIGLSIEASELLECFLWKSPEDASIDKIKEELADVLNFAFQMADKYGLASSRSCWRSFSGMYKSILWRKPEGARKSMMSFNRQTQ